MVLIILIFRISFFLFFLIVSNTINAQTITGKARIIDGDTIHIGKNKIRLHGIDAPEYKQNCFIDKKTWNCGIQSTLFLKKTIIGKTVNCFVTDIDRYNRYLANCYIGEVHINKYLVRNGWAIAYRYYSIDFVKRRKLSKKRKNWHMARKIPRTLFV